MKYLDPDGRAVLLAGQSLKFGWWDHSYIVIKPTGENRTLMADYIDKDTGYIALDATVGNIPGKGINRLEKRLNKNSLSKAEKLVEIKVPGMSTEQLEMNVLEAFLSYEQGSEKYQESAEKGKNCHAFTAGVLLAAGVGKERVKNYFMFFADVGVGAWVEEIGGEYIGYNRPVVLPDATANDPVVEEPTEEEDVDG